MFVDSFSVGRQVLVGDTGFDQEVIPVGLVVVNGAAKVGVVGGSSQVESGAEILLSCDQLFSQ